MDHRSPLSAQLSVTRKRKILLTVSVIFFDREGRRHHASITHNNDMAADLQDLVAAVPQESRPGGPDETFTVLMAVPSRPTTYVPPNAQPIVPARIGSRKEEKGLAPAPASLPVKPAWIPEVAADEPVTFDEAEEVEPAAKPYSTARQVWQVSLRNGDRPTTLQEALNGTSIVEWPKFEVWPSSVVLKLVTERKLEFVTRREPDSRGNRTQQGDQGWGGRKRLIGEVEDVADGAMVDGRDQEEEEEEADFDRLEAAIASDNLHLAGQHEDNGSEG